jgi:hypothetical protein
VVKVADNRHGPLHVSTYVNRRTVYESIVEEFNQRKSVGTVRPESLAPSASWFYKQFTPSRGDRATAEGHTGRFQLCLRTVARTHRKPHPDEHFCMALKRYLYHTAVDFRDHAVSVSTDDKNNIPVGHPGLPIAAIEGGRRVLTQRTGAGSAVQAVDRDAGSGGMIKLIPTVTLARVPPKDVDDTWLRGQVRQVRNCRYQTWP